MRDVYRLMMVVLLSVTVQMGCQDVTVGYLRTENAKYVPDTMLVKSVLDPAEDAQQIKFETPWQSTSINGVQGTFPIRYEIRSIQCDNGHPEAASQIQMIKRGVVMLPWNHTVPPGRYVINIRVSNEGYTYDLDSVFTVVVK